MFGFDGENIQKHAFLMGHSDIFAITKGGEIEVEFYTADNHVLPEEKQFVESKDLISVSIQEYEDCLRIASDPDNYTGRQVREANEFLAKYKDKDDLPF